MPAAWRTYQIGEADHLQRRNAHGWHYDEAFGSVEDASREVRGQFISAMDLAEAEKFDQIEDLDALHGGQALLVSGVRGFLCVLSAGVPPRRLLGWGRRLAGRGSGK
jgi:hypothetical protein